MDVSAQLSSKGQLTVPKVVRDALGLAEGDQVVFASRASAPSSLGRQVSSISPAASLSRRRAWHPVARVAAAHAGSAGEDSRLSAFLDTNVLIRHLTGDPPAQARRAGAFLATADELLGTGT